MRKVYLGAFALLLNSLICLANDTANIEIIEDKRAAVTQSETSFEYSCNELDTKIASFQRLKGTGIGLIVCGAIMSGIGIGMIASAGGQTSYQTNSNGETSGDLTGGLGAVIASIGIPVCIAGIIIAPIGAKKANDYKLQKKQQNCQISLRVRPKAVELVCNF
jgi:hypothetical protein